MPPPEPTANPTATAPTLLDRIASADWRAWLALSWALWFGLLYSRTIIERRGPKLRAALAAWTDPASTVKR